MAKRGRPKGLPKTGGSKKRVSKAGYAYGEAPPDELMRGDAGYLSPYQKDKIDEEIKQMRLDDLNGEKLAGNLSNSPTARLWLTHLRAEAEIDQFHLWVVGEMVADAQDQLGKATRSSAKARTEGYMAAAFLSDTKRGRAYMNWLGFRPTEIRTWVSLSKMVLKNMKPIDAALANSREAADV